MPTAPDYAYALLPDLAIDRDTLVKQVVRDGIPAQFFTNPGAAAGPEPEKYLDGDVKYDPEKAKQLLD